MEPPNLPVSFDIKSTQDIAMAYMSDGEIVASPVRWWFVPHWHKGDVKGWKATTFNAKIETAQEKPTFRTAWRQNRCIIPATGYYEWTEPKGSKQPHHITLEQNVSVFFFAGLYSTLRDGSQTTTIMTQEASPQIVELHHRMPVLLQVDKIEPWLGCDDGDYGWSGGFNHYAANPFGMKNDGPEVIEPYE